jgi:RNA polymerase sigma factor (sigma-70 family)
MSAIGTRASRRRDLSVTTHPEPPPQTPQEAARVGLLYHFCRLQIPAVTVGEPSFRGHLDRTFRIFLPKAEGPCTWASYLDGLYPLDWSVCIGCLEGQDAAWELLFAARTGRSDTLLVDALRARACRLYPRDEEKQESSVSEFWSHLLVPETEHGTAVLARYDGQRPLAPWLIRVFQNWHLSKLRQHAGVTALPDDDIAMPLPSGPRSDTRWHEMFVVVARDWLGELPDSERLILGLRWRYKMSQRDVAHLLGVHEGTISRQTDKLRDRALEAIGRRLIEQGWAGEDLEGLILTEMGGLLVDDPRLSADQLGKLLAAKGKGLPG